MIQIENIHKTFRSGRGIVSALKGVSFKMEKGSTTAVVDNSGSGKSTLLNCIGGLECPDKGCIVCFGQDILALSAKELRSGFKTPSEAPACGGTVLPRAAGFAGILFTRGCITDLFRWLIPPAAGLRFLDRPAPCP